MAKRVPLLQYASSPIRFSDSECFAAFRHTRVGEGNGQVRNQRLMIEQ